METILCVDDDPNILDAFQRQLRKQYHLELATSGAAALELVQNKGPFSVIVADMNMPGMNGVQLLAKVRGLSPDTVRIMLTGAADFQTALTEVNDGNIFRFLAKPCPSETLALALEAGLAQYRLITAERELLEKTLKGSIQAMTDILALTNPAAFSRALRLRDYSLQMANFLKVPDIWQIEVASMLSQVGCVTLPAEVMEKAFAGEVLNPQESEMFESHPQVGGQLIVNIPRMEKIAYMITHQQSSVSEMCKVDPTDSGHVQETGAYILKAAMELDLLLTRGNSGEKSKGIMGAKSGRYPASILAALLAVNVPELEKVERMSKIDQLRVGMILAEDLRTKAGVLVVQKNQEVSDTLRHRLLNFHVQRLIPDEVRVFISNRGV